MKYGHFDDKAREYVIDTPRTPYPWINYLGCEQFFGIISNTAGGYCFYRDARLRRVTRYRYNNMPVDNGGRYFYIKDGDTVWNPGWKPVKTELDSYSCRHGMGYTIITGKNSPLLHAASSCILNAIKHLAKLPDDLPLISPEVIDSLGMLKKNIFKSKGISLDLAETLTALSVSVPSNPAARLAMRKLAKLYGCEMHISHLPTAGDESGLRKLGINLTSEPRFTSRNLFME